MGCERQPALPRSGPEWIERQAATTTSSAATSPANALDVDPSAQREPRAREREVLQLVAEGKTSGETAKAMHISVKTVETHRRNITQKLGLHGTAELTKYAIREGLTSLET